MRSWALRGTATAPALMPMALTLMTLMSPHRTPAAWSRSRSNSPASCITTTTSGDMANFRLKPRSELSAALAADSHQAFVGVALFSALLNVLYLTGSFFMLAVYDRVLPSRSVPTLVGITLLALILFSVQGVLDIVRSRILVRVGGSLAKSVSERVHHVLTKLPLQNAASRHGQPLRDLDQIRSFLSSLGPAALFDLPWLPLYLGICYLFHPLIGIAATVGGLVLVVVALLTELLTRGPSGEAAGLGSSRTSLAEASRRNAEAVQAMGMAGRLGD